MSAARSEILEAIRGALGPGPREQEREAAASPTTIAAPMAGVELIEHFLERVRDYQAGAVSVAADAVSGAVSELARRHAAQRLIVPAGFPAPWRPAELELVEDTGELDPRELERFDGALTSAALAIAETGTLVLDAGPDQGRRALSLLPDLHLCVVAASRVVADIPDAITPLGHEVAAHRRPLTFISGPSATADIELRRVHGVHGPRRLEVIVAHTA